MSGSLTDLSHHFLIAMPGMVDPAFAGTMIYLCSHDEEGAMGLTVNRPLDVPLRALFEQFDLSCVGNRGSEALLNGGPVQRDWGFVLHSDAAKQWQGTQQVGCGVKMTASRDIIEDLARGKDAPEHSCVVLGYAGWGAGQLEAELLDNAWLTVPADAVLLFETPVEQRADRAAASIGVDLSKLSNSAGRA